MVRTFQLTKVLSRLTVLENMRLGAHGPAGRELLRAMFAAVLARQEQANTASGRGPARAVHADAKKREDFAGTLSGGQRKLLEMARALMADPELVMLDEPMAGVNPALKQSPARARQVAARARAAPCSSSSTTWTWSATSATGSS